MFRDWMTRTTGCKTKKEKHVQRLNLVCLYRTSVILHTEFCVLCSLNLEHPMLLGSHPLACPMQICCSQKQPTSHSFRRKQASKSSPHWYPCNHLGVHVYYGKRLFSCYTPGSLVDQKIRMISIFTDLTLPHAEWNQWIQPHKWVNSSIHFGYKSRVLHQWQQLVTSKGTWDQNWKKHIFKNHYG